MWLDFEAEDMIPGSHQPPCYSEVFIEQDQVMAHNHDFLDKSPRFDLRTANRQDWFQDQRVETDKTDQTVEA